VLQTAYVKALASRAALQDASSIVSWFFQILRRSLADHQRHRAAGERATNALRAKALPPAIDPSLQAAVCACVESLLPDLPLEQREILRRVDLEGATPAGAAASLGITPGNAAVRLHRARKALRAKLEAVCGSCTKHKCLDCHCGGRAR
jgi:RNA polymerase sigma-70 factor (ECF subfamily)